MSKTIPEFQIGMVVVGLRLLEYAIATAALDEDDIAYIEGDGGKLPDTEEIEALCERLEAIDQGDDPA
jgi:hypothetical protein